MDSKQVRARFKQDMLNTHDVIGKIANRSTLPDGFPVKWTVLTAPHIDSKATNAVFLPGIALSVQAIPAVEEGMKIADKASAAGNILKDSLSAPIIYRDLSKDDAEVSKRMQEYVIPRTGGKDAPKENVVRTLKIFVDDTLKEYPGITIGEITVFLPAPQIKDMYVPSFAFAVGGASGEYGAYLVIDDRLVSTTPLLIPYMGGTYLMDYSDTKNHHLIEARQIAVMDSVEMAALQPKFNYSVIVLSPKKEEKIVFNMPRFPQGDNSLKMGGSFGELTLKSVGANIGDAKVDTGAPTGIKSDIIFRTSDLSRNGIVLLVRVMVATVYEDLELVTRNIRNAIGLV